MSYGQWAGAPPQSRDALEYWSLQKSQIGDRYDGIIEKIYSKEEEHGITWMLVLAREDGHKLCIRIREFDLLLKACGLLKWTQEATPTPHVCVGARIAFEVTGKSEPKGRNGTRYNRYDLKFMQDQTGAPLISHVPGTNNGLLPYLVFAYNQRDPKHLAKLAGGAPPVQQQAYQQAPVMPPAHSMPPAHQQQAYQQQAHSTPLTPQQQQGYTPPPAQPAYVPPPPVAPPVAPPQQQQSFTPPPPPPPPHTNAPAPNLGWDPGQTPPF